MLQLQHTQQFFFLNKTFRFSVNSLILLIFIFLVSVIKSTGGTHSIPFPRSTHFAQCKVFAAAPYKKFEGDCTACGL